MNKQTSGIAMLAGALLLGWSGVASAYSSGVFDAKSTRCNACHTGNGIPAPSVSFYRDGASVAGLRVFAGQLSKVLLDVRTLPGKGLGLTITASEGLELQSASGETRVDRGFLSHRAIIAAPTGQYRLPFSIRAPASSCGQTFTLTANVAVVDRNRSPSGDGVATSATSVFVECPDTAKAAVVAEPRALAPTIKPSIAPTSPALPEPAAGAITARVMAPTGQITAPVRVGVDALRAPGGVAQLELANVERLDANSRPAEAHFLSTGGGGSGSVTIYFKQAASHILVDCTVRSPTDVRFTIDAGSLHIENTVPAADGHAVTVVPRGGIQRDVQVVLKSTGRKWSFSSCDLTPVR